MIVFSFTLHKIYKQCNHCKVGQWDTEQVFYCYSTFVEDLTGAMEMQLFCNSKPFFALKHKMQKENILLRNEDWNIFHCYIK